MKDGSYSKPSHAAWDIAKWGGYESSEELQKDLKILEQSENPQTQKESNQQNTPSLPQEMSENEIDKLFQSITKSNDKTPSKRDTKTYHEGMDKSQWYDDKKPSYDDVKSYTDKQRYESEHIKVSPKIKLPNKLQTEEAKRQFQSMEFTGRLGKLHEKGKEYIQSFIDAKRPDDLDIALKNLTSYVTQLDSYGELEGKQIDRHLSVIGNYYMYQKVLHSKTLYRGTDLVELDEWLKQGKIRSDKNAYTPTTISRYIAKIYGMDVRVGFDIQSFPDIWFHGYSRKGMKNSQYIESPQNPRDLFLSEIRLPKWISLKSVKMTIKFKVSKNSSKAKEYRNKYAPLGELLFLEDRD